MNRATLRCAIYTRKSSEEGLEQGFNSLDAQREACEAFVLSQRQEGWSLVPTLYDDGGYSGGNMERPALKQLLADIDQKKVQVVVVYKVDRLTRSLADFAKIVELFDAKGVSFVSVTQQFNTTSSMGRLTLNVLLSFAQFEREVTGERIRDKIAASKRKGMWMGGIPPIGYRPHERTLVIDAGPAEQIREIYRLYVKLGGVRQLKTEVDRLGWKTPARRSRQGKDTGGRAFSRGHLYRILGNPVYVGKIIHKGGLFDGQHPAIIDQDLWQAVQNQMQSNLQGHRSRETAVHPSLLARLVFDGNGNRLTPTHTRKGALRYRYYVSHSLLMEGRETVPEAVRWPAQGLEEAVLSAITGLLLDESRLLHEMGDRSASDAKGQLLFAGNLASQLAHGSLQQKIGILQRVVRHITVHAHQLEIAIVALAILGESHPAADGKEYPVRDQDTIRVTLPVELKRRGHAMKLIVHPTGGAATRGPDPMLVARIAKAHDWFNRLRSGQCNSIGAIEKEEKVSTTHMAQVLPLAFLAPDIIERIIQGGLPLELDTSRLMRLTSLPLDWREQRVMFGLPP